MPNPPHSEKSPQPYPDRSQEAVDAIRHVGPTLEAEGIFLPTGDLPENRIEREGLRDAVDMHAVGADAYDLEAEAMGAERLRTRLPDDTSSDPHTDLEPENTGGANPNRDPAA